MTQFRQCGSFTAAGLSSCSERLKKAVIMLISVPGTAYTAAELASFTKTKSNLSLAAGIVTMAIPLSNYKDTTDEPTEEKSALGTKGIYDDPIPSGVAYLDRSFDDYRVFFGFNNSLVDVEFITKDGYRIMTPTATSGSYKGLAAKMYAPIRMPGENVMEAHPIHFYFEDVEEFRNMEALPMTGYGRTDMVQAVPVGLNLRALGEYNTTTGVINLKAVSRSSDVGKTGLTSFTVLSSNCANVVVTLTDSGAGAYAVKILKNTTDELVVGDYVVLQGVLTVATFATYITSPLYIIVSTTTP